MTESTPNPVKKKKANNYIDNKKFYAEMIIYRRLYDESLIAGEPRPIVSRYIGECIMLIATRLATRPNFVGYSYKDEMISDGIENCLAYIHNFNPEKSTNPFAYFTQIIYYAFLRRIQKEKKQLYIKHKSFENSMIMNTLVDMAPEDRSHYSAAFINVSEKLSELVEKFEAKNPIAPKAKKGVEKFIEDDENE
jgi:ABC-type microcin C transport system permease subunit YejE